MTKSGLQCGGIPGESLDAIRKEEIFHSLGTDIGLDAEGVVNPLPSFSGENTSSSIIGAAKLGPKSRAETA